MMAAMEPLLYGAGVDVVFAGHVHAYERSVYLMISRSYITNVFEHDLLFT